MTKAELVYRVQHYGKDNTMEALRVELNKAQAQVYELEALLGKVADVR